MMINKQPTSIEAVVAKHLCTGCGACAGMAPGLFRMEDQPDTGLRPVRIWGVSNPAGEREALAVCPGAGAGPKPVPAPTDRVPAGAPCVKEWGSVLEIWEGHAADAATRWRGSSGGAVTALAAFALDNGEAEGVVHVRQSAANALLNESVVSRSTQDLVAAAGSRYAPASPCDKLAEIAGSSGPLVFIGKPCDVQAVAAAAKRQPAIARNIALTMSIFCAGAPSTNGTRALLSALGVPADARVTGIRYRGEGWPGTMNATYLSAGGEEGSTRGISYEQGWGEILQKHRQWRCHLCADHTGEFADISVGDPWDKPRGEGNAEGSSLIVVRSARGRAFLARAIAAGVIIATPRSLTALADAQPNLARTRRIMFGRLMGLRILGLGAPRYQGWKLGGLWLQRTGLRDKLSSVLGTARRAVRRKLWQPEISQGGDHP
jgi:coenzyme F420 hydrogenase subunit beta